MIVEICHPKFCLVIFVRWLIKDKFRPFWVDKTQNLFFLFLNFTFSLIESVNEADFLMSEIITFPAYNLVLKVLKCERLIKSEVIVKLYDVLIEINQFAEEFSTPLFIQNEQIRNRRIQTWPF